MADNEKKYYIVLNGAQSGPYNKEDLAAMQDFTPQTRVFVIGGGSEFINASDIPELASVFTKPKAQPKKPEQPKVAAPDGAMAERLRREAEEERRRRRAEEEMRQPKAPQTPGAAAQPGGFPQPTVEQAPAAQEEAVWFLAVNGQPTGPYTASEVAANLSSPSQPVIRKGDTTWHKYTDYPELNAQSSAADGLPLPPVSEPVITTQTTVQMPDAQIYGQNAGYVGTPVQNYPVQEPAVEEDVYGNPTSAPVIGFIVWLLVSIACLACANISSVVDEIYYYCGMQEVELTTMSAMIVALTAVPAIAGLVQASKAKSAYNNGLPGRAAKSSGLATGYGLATLFASLGVAGALVYFLSQTSVF